MSGSNGGSGRLSRRRLLALSGATVVASGCLDGAGDPAADGRGRVGEGGTDGDGEDGADTRDGPTESGTGDPPTPTEPPAESPPAGEPPAGCPDLGGDDVVEVVCSDRIDPTEVAMALDQSTERIAVGEPISFVLENGTERTFETNFYGWAVRKHVDGRWFRVAPLGSNDPLMAIGPGESHEWTVTVDNDGLEAGEPVAYSEGTEAVTVSGLGPGYYAFDVDGWFEDDDHESKTVYAATFELEGDPLRLTPSNAVDSLSLEPAEDEGGEVLVARTDRGDPDDEFYRPGVYELTRVDGPDEDPEPVILEQVLADDRFRDALALAITHDVDRVRLEEYDSVRPAFGGPDGVYEFQGVTFEVTTRVIEGG